LEQEVNAKRRELEDIERKINDERRNERDMQEHETMYRDYDKRLSENTNPNKGPSSVVVKPPISKPTPVPQSDSVKPQKPA
jgi:hypothetical protein